VSGQVPISLLNVVGMKGAELKRAKNDNAITLCKKCTNEVEKEQKMMEKRMWVHLSANVVLLL